MSVLRFAESITSPAPEARDLPVDASIAPEATLAALRGSLTALSGALAEISSSIGRYLDALAAARADGGGVEPDVSIAAPTEVAEAPVAAPEPPAEPAPIEDRNVYGETAAEALERAQSDAGAHAVAVAEAAALTLVTPQSAADLLPLLDRIGYAIAATPRADFGDTGLRGRWATPDEAANVWNALVRRGLRLGAFARQLGVPLADIRAALRWDTAERLEQALGGAYLDGAPVDLDPEFRRLAGLS